MTNTGVLNGQKIDLDISELQPISYCNTCDDNDALFNLPETFWELREEYYCTNCQSRPRERSLFYILEKYYPKWYTMKIHEHDPVFRGFSNKLKLHNINYTFSLSAGSKDQSHASSNLYRKGKLDKLDLPDNSVDVFISQDVLNVEDDYISCINEIKRVLKPGAAHIFTMPFVKGIQKSEGKEFGYDMVSKILKETGMVSTIHFIDDTRYSIKGLYNEVVLSFKS